MATLISGLFTVWAYVMRAAPVLLAVVLAVASYFTALRAGIRLWDDSPVGSAHTPDYFVEDFAWLRVRQGGLARTQMTGNMLTHIPANDLISLSPVAMVKFSANAPAIDISARSAQLNNMTGELALNTDVRVRRRESGNTAGFEMNAPRMMLQTDREILHAYDDVHLRRAGQELKTASLTVNNLTGEVSAQQRVQLVLPPPQKQDSR